MSHHAYPLYRITAVAIVLAGLSSLLVSACGDENTKPLLPDKLPFTYTRDAAGTPLTTAEQTEFAKKITAFWKNVEYFKWINRVSFGMDASTGQKDWSVWWGGSATAIKSGDTVTFQANAGSTNENAFIPSSAILSSAMAGYLLTGDADVAKVAEMYAKGLSATMLGMVYDENDTIHHLMSRITVGANHSYTIEGGKKKAVDYNPWHAEYAKWNCERFQYQNNPWWGEVWVTNMRSKDDICHIFRAVPMLMYGAAYAKSSAVKAAAQEALTLIEGFSKDIVDHEYQVRTKDRNGQPYTPEQDLAYFTVYDFIDRNAECNAKISAAYIGYSEARENDCEDGFGGSYETMATTNHYYNLAIIRAFHLSAIYLALVKEDNDTALRLLKGMTKRIEDAIDPNISGVQKDHPSFLADVTLTILQAAMVGFPMTAAEARMVKAYFEDSITNFESFVNWDLWDSSIPDGSYQLSPGHTSVTTGIDKMAVLMEYCYSPFRNPAGAQLIDCDIIKNPSRWGE